MTLNMKRLSKHERILAYLMVGIIYWTWINIYPIGITRIESFNTRKKYKVNLFMNNA